MHQIPNRQSKNAVWRLKKEIQPKKVLQKPFLFQKSRKKPSPYKSI